MIIVPWVLFQRYGDRRVLDDSYDAMRRWVEFQRVSAETQLPLRLRGAELDPRQRDRQALLWNAEPNFGTG